MRPDDAEGTSVAVGPGDSGGTSVAADDSDVVAGTLDDAASSGPIEVGGDVFEVDSESSPHPAARARHSTVTTPIACVARPFLSDTGVAVDLDASVDGLDTIGKAAATPDQDGFSGDGRGPVRPAAPPGAASLQHGIVDRSPAGADDRRINATRSTVVLTHGHRPPDAVMAAPSSRPLGAGKRNTLDVDTGRSGPNDGGGATATIEPVGHV